MARREEIESAWLGKEVQSNHRYDEKSFKEAVEWADKTMIGKAREYLKKAMYVTPIFEHDDDEQPVYYVCASCCNSVEEFIEHFCKSMEEQYELIMPEVGDRVKTSCKEEH